MDIFFTQCHILNAARNRIFKKKRHRINGTLWTVLQFRCKIWLNVFSDAYFFKCLRFCSFISKLKRISPAILDHRGLVWDAQIRSLHAEWISPYKCGAGWDQGSRKHGRWQFCTSLTLFSSFHWCDQNPGKEQLMDGKLMPVHGLRRPQSVLAAEGLMVAGSQDSCSVPAQWIRKLVCCCLELSRSILRDCPHLPRGSTILPNHSTNPRKIAQLVSSSIGQ